jgi:hypothetical protein
MLYFFKGLQIFWGLPSNENQCALNNFQKDTPCRIEKNRILKRKLTF